MSVSSVAAVAPVASPQPVSASAHTTKRTDEDNDASRTPPPKPPLPPGQGTRIDQLA